MLWCLHTTSLVSCVIFLFGLKITINNVFTLPVKPSDWFSTGMAPTCACALKLAFSHD